MASVEMNRLLDQLRIRLPGALDTAIFIELFSTLQEFFTESNIWRETVSFDVKATTANPLEEPEAYAYEIYPAAGQIVRLLEVRNGDGVPVAADMPIPGHVRLALSPNADGVYYATVALSVSDPVTRDGLPMFPTWVLQRYMPCIQDGVMGRMMTQLAKPYTSPAIGAVHLRRFRQSIGKARTEAQRQNVRAAAPWRFPTFAN